MSEKIEFERLFQRDANNRGLNAMHIFSSVSMKSSIIRIFTIFSFVFNRTTIFITDAVVYYGNGDVAALAFL